MAPSSRRSFHCVYGSGLAKVSVLPDSGAFGEASKIIKQLARIPAPVYKSDGDAQPDRGTGSCAKDYNVKCPMGFVNVGPIYGGSKEYCAASSQYDGPCISEAYNFEGMSTQAKGRWSKLCLTSWPCVDCAPDLTSTCPKGWTRVNDTLSCTPPATYTGPCRGDDAFLFALGRDATSPAYLKRISIDFSGYNAEMLKLWSAKCGAPWPCASAAAVARRLLRVAP